MTVATDQGTAAVSALPQSRQHLRKRMERAVEQLLAALDAMDTDPDLEPSLGSLQVDRWSDQRRWAQGGDQGERETVCEDEGSYRDGDDEPDRDGEGTANPQWLIAGRSMSEVDGPDAWRPIDPDEDPGEVVVRCEAGLS